MDLTVREINPETTDFVSSLGLTKERADELVKHIKHADIDCRTYSQMVERVSKECKAPVELFFLGMMMGKRLAAGDIDKLIKQALERVGISKD